MESNLQIIVIPGIMGSTLNNKYIQIWPWLDYTLDLYKSLKDISNENIYAKKLEYFTYKELVKELKNITNNVTTFPYDWRQNNIDHFDELEKKFDENADEIIIVAHSMGGIVAKLFLNHFRNSDLIKKVSKIITLGTPWNGSMDAYKTLKYGKAIPERKLFKGFILNEKTSKEISSSFPSIYQILPSSSYSELSRLMEEKPLISYKINDQHYDDHDVFFEDHLKDSFLDCKHDYTKVIEDYRELISQDIPAHIQHFEIIGINEGTIAGIVENSLEEAEGDFRSGDGTVPLFSALTNEKNSFFINKAEHSKLPKNPVAINLIKDIIYKDTEKLNQEFVESEDVFKDLKSLYNKGYNGKIVKIACPVEVSLVNQDGNVVFGAIETIDEEGLYELSKEEYNVKTLGNTTYILFDDEDVNADSVEKLVIQAYDKGPTTVTVDEYVNSENTKRNAFKTFIINPGIQAELRLSEDLNKNELYIEEMGHEPLPITSTVHDVKNEKILFPETKATINGEKTLIISEHEVIVKGHIYINILESKKGTYDIDNTFVKVNEEIFTLNGRSDLLLDLPQGYNSIEYFTKDVFGNIEPPKKIEVLVLPEDILEIEIEFLPNRYELKVIYKEIYTQALEKYKLGASIITKKFDNEIDIYDDKVFYRVPHRKLNIDFQNVFKEDENYEITIAEDAIASIFEGTASVETLEQFCDFLHLKNNYKIKFVRPDNTRNYTKISEENISKCSEILIEDNVFKIRILKNKKYQVSFQNLAEDIVLNKVKLYPLEFKLIDTEWKKEIVSMDLQYFIKILGLKDNIFSDNKEVKWDASKNVYIAEVNLDEINQKLNQDYWLANSEPILEINIIDKTSENSLRSQDISIRVG